MKNRKGETLTPQNLSEHWLEDYHARIQAGMTSDLDIAADQLSQILPTLEAELQVAEEFAIEHCRHLLHGWDRDGYDLWWEIPSFYPEEALFLIDKGLLVRNSEGLVAWKEVLDEEPELDT